MLWFESFSSVL